MPMQDWFNVELSMKNGKTKEIHTFEEAVELIGFILIFFYKL